MTGPKLAVSKVALRKLGHYVYVYVDPRDDRVFYVGKGTGSRALEHLSLTGNSKKARLIREIRIQGMEPRIDILTHGLPNQETALRVEAAIIDLLGVKRLTNEVRGWRSLSVGRMDIKQLASHYDPQPVTIKEPALLVRINELYRYGMTDVELYDTTRGVWVLGEKREQVRYAVAVFEGLVLEVYRVTGWLPAGSTFSTRDGRGVQSKGRWEFVGTLASEPIRKKYLGRSVKHYFAKGAQNPVAYVKVDCL